LFVCRIQTRYITRVKSLLLAASIFFVLLAAPSSAHAEPPADPFFGADKAKHFTVSAALAASGYGLSAIVFDGRKNRAVLGATLALGAGYSKEVLDAVGFGTPSWKDFVWDVIGTGVGVGLAVALDAAFSPLSGSSTTRAQAAR
jgi:putative lipoprotein